MKKYLLFSCFLLFISAQAEKKLTIEQVKNDLKNYSFSSILDSITSDSSYIDFLIIQIREYRKKGALDSSIQIANLALTYGESIDYYSGVASVHNEQGINNKNQGRFDKALKNYKACLDISININDSVLIASSYGNIAALYRNEGIFDKAVENYIKCLAIFEKLKNERHISNCYSGIGLIYFSQLKFQEAIEYIEKSLEINIKIKNDDGIANNYNNLANIYTEMDSLNKAIDLNRKALSIYINKKDIRNESISYGNLATQFCSIYNELQKVDKLFIDSAIFYNKKAEEIRIKINDRVGLLRSYSLYGEIYRSIGDNKLSLIYYKKAEEIAEEIGAIRLKLIATEGLAYIYESMKDYKTSIHYYKKLSNYRDTVFNESKSKEIGKLEATYEMEKKLAEEEQKLKEENRKLKEEKDRRDNIQYSMIFILIIAVFGAVLALGKINISPKFAEGLIFFAFLIFFEFCLVLLDPYIDNYSGGEPAYKLLFNAVLAGAIFPVHAFFETLLKKRFKIIINKNIY